MRSSLLMMLRAKLALSLGLGVVYVAARRMR
jgi:hypothetical protein